MPSVIMVNGSSNGPFSRFSDFRIRAVSVLVYGTLPQSCSPRGATGSALTSGWEESGFKPQRGHHFTLLANSSQVTQM